MNNFNLGNFISGMFFGFIVLSILYDSYKRYSVIKQCKKDKEKLRETILEDDYFSLVVKIMDKSKFKNVFYKYNYQKASLILELFLSFTIIFIVVVAIIVYW